MLQLRFLFPKPVDSERLESPKQTKLQGPVEVVVLVKDPCRGLISILEVSLEVFISQRLV